MSILLTGSPSVSRHRVGDWIRRHPIAAFLVWNSLGTQSLALTPVVAEHGFGVVWPTEPFLIVGTVLGLLLPVVVITRIVDGPEGLRDLRDRVVRVGVPVRWYLLPLVVVPLLSLAPTIIAQGAPDLSPGAATVAIGLGFGLNLAVVLLTVNIWEEMAWTGFVQARFADRFAGRRFSALRAAAATAPFFTLQHLFLMFGGTLVQGLVQFALLLVFAVVFRSLMGWIYNRTDSLFLAGLLHAAGNAATVGSLVGPSLVAQLYGGTSDISLAFGIPGLVVLAATRLRLGQDRRPTAR